MARTEQSAERVTAPSVSEKSNRVILPESLCPREAKIFSRSFAEKSFRLELERDAERPQVDVRLSGRAGLPDIVVALEFESAGKIPRKVVLEADAIGEIGALVATTGAGGASGRP
ncbi:hypothetical protein D3C83_43250 [compost metagenome]